MNTVIIEGPERATQAGTWANANTKHTWQMGITGNPFSNKYAFMFSNPQDATHFALKWR